LTTYFVLLFFGIGLFEESAEVIELVLPEDAVEGEPVGGLLHRGYCETAHPDPAGLLLLDEASVLKNTEMLHHGGHGDVVRTGKFSNGGLPLLQGGEDGSTRWIAEGTEGCIEAGWILNHMVMYPCARHHVKENVIFGKQELDELFREGYFAAAYIGCPPVILVASQTALNHYI
jgi:hypothetical protein